MCCLDNALTIKLHRLKVNRRIVKRLAKDYDAKLKKNEIREIAKSDTVTEAISKIRYIKVCNDIVK